MGLSRRQFTQEFKLAAVRRLPRPRQWLPGLARGRRPKPAKMALVLTGSNIP